MDCEKFESALPLLALDELGELDEARKGAVEAHVAGCAACRAKLADLRATLSLLTEAAARLPEAKLSPARREALASAQAETSAMQRILSFAFPAAFTRHSSGGRQALKPAPNRRDSPAGGRFPVLAISVAAGILIVIALGALLLPPLSRAREEASPTACLNNLHQISKGMFTYEEPNANNFFPLTGWGDSAGQTAAGAQALADNISRNGEAAAEVTAETAPTAQGLHEDHGAYIEGGRTESGSLTSFGAVPATVSNQKVFGCPSTSDTSAMAETPASGVGGRFGRFAMAGSANAASSNADTWGRRPAAANAAGDYYSLLSPKYDADKLGQKGEAPGANPAEESRNASTQAALDTQELSALAKAIDAQRTNPAAENGQISPRDKYATAGAMTEAQRKEAEAVARAQNYLNQVKGANGVMQQLGAADQQQPVDQQKAYESLTAAEQFTRLNRNADVAQDTKNIEGERARLRSNYDTYKLGQSGKSANADLAEEAGTASKQEMITMGQLGVLAKDISPHREYAMAGRNNSPEVLYGDGGVFKDDKASLWSGNLGLQSGQAAPDANGAAPSLAADIYVPRPRQGNIPARGTVALGGGIGGVAVAIPNEGKDETSPLEIYQRGEGQAALPAGKPATRTAGKPGAGATQAAQQFESSGPLPSAASPAPAAAHDRLIVKFARPAAPPAAAAQSAEEPNLNTCFGFARDPLADLESVQQRAAQDLLKTKPEEKLSGQEGTYYFTHYDGYAPSGGPVGASAVGGGVHIAVGDSLWSGNETASKQAAQQTPAVAATPPASSPVAQYNALASPPPAAEEVLAVPVFQAGPVNPWMMTQADPLSTFAVDVDTASYAIARTYIGHGQLPPPASVRMEEFVNTFDYNYPTQGKGVFSVYSEAGPSPFHPAVTLLKIGVKARSFGLDARKPTQFVFVVDASGSMEQPDRLPLVKIALDSLVDQLGPNDRVSLVTFQTKPSLVLEAISASEKEKILAAVNGLRCGGTTNLNDGLKLGYETAARNFITGGTNRVILCTDGMVNVGETEAAAMLKSVDALRRQGITLTALGCGYGAYDDALLVKLADQGDGDYVFVGSETDAKRVFTEDSAAAMQAVANDAKYQVSFDPARVRRYRLIGFEKRVMAAQDFRNDAVKGGTVSSGGARSQSSTALYELELLPTAEDEVGGDLGTVVVRYRDAETGQVEEISSRLPADMVRRSRKAGEDSPRFLVAACAAEFAEILRHSEYARNDTLAQVRSVLAPAAAQLPLDARVQELLQLVQRAESLR